MLFSKLPRHYLSNKDGFTYHLYQNLAMTLLSSVEIKNKSAKEEIAYWLKMWGYVQYLHINNNHSMTCDILYVQLWLLHQWACRCKRQLSTAVCPKSQRMESHCCKYKENV